MFMAALLVIVKHWKQARRIDKNTVTQLYKGIQLSNKKNKLLIRATAWINPEQKKPDQIKSIHCRFYLIEFLDNIQ